MFLKQVTKMKSTLNQFKANPFIHQLRTKPLLNINNIKLFSENNISSKTIHKKDIKSYINDILNLKEEELLTKYNSEISDFNNYLKVQLDNEKIGKINEKLLSIDLSNPDKVFNIIEEFVNKKDFVNLLNLKRILQKNNNVLYSLKSSKSKDYLEYLRNSQSILEKLTNSLNLKSNKENVRELVVSGLNSNKHALDSQVKDFIGKKYNFEFPKNTNQVKPSLNILDSITKSEEKLGFIESDDSIKLIFHTYDTSKIYRTLRMFSLIDLEKTNKLIEEESVKVIKTSLNNEQSPNKNVFNYLSSIRKIFSSKNKKDDSNNLSLIDQEISSNQNDFLSTAILKIKLLENSQNNLISHLISLNNITGINYLHFLKYKQEIEDLIKQIIEQQNYFSENGEFISFLRNNIYLNHIELLLPFANKVEILKIVNLFESKYFNIEEAVKNVDNIMFKSSFDKFNSVNYDKFIRNLSLVNFRVNNLEKFPLFDYDVASITKWLSIHSTAETDVDVSIFIFKIYLAKNFEK